MNKSIIFIKRFCLVFLIAFLTNVFVSGIWNYIKYKEFGSFNLDTGFVIAIIIATIITTNDILKKRKN